MKLVKLDDDVWVNPEHIVSVESVSSYVVVTTSKGVRRVDADAYEVLDRLDPWGGEA